MFFMHTQIISHRLLPLLAGLFALSGGALEAVAFGGDSQAGAAPSHGVRIALTGFSAASNGDERSGVGRYRARSNRLAQRPIRSADNFFRDESHAQDNEGSQDVEVTFWNSVKDSSDPDMFEAYLERYPDGAFASLARIKLEKLKTSLEPEAPPQPSVAEEQEPRRFDSPEHEGIRLNSRPAAGSNFDVVGVANSFCQRMGFTKMLEYRVADSRKTIALEDSTVFRNKKRSYNSYRFIECGSHHPDGN